MPTKNKPYKKGSVGDAEFRNAKASDKKTGGSSYVVHRTTKDSRGWRSEAEARGSMPIGGGTNSELARQKRLGNQQTASGPKSRKPTTKKNTTKKKK